MDVSALAAVSSASSNATSRLDASVSVLRKSMDVEQSLALKLIQAISIPGLGQNVDLRA